LADKLFCIRVVAQCKDVEVQQAALFLAIHNCGDDGTFGGSRLPSIGEALNPRMGRRRVAQNISMHL
jgi:hypothetical protein